MKMPGDKLSVAQQFRRVPPMYIQIDVFFYVYFKLVDEMACARELDLKKKRGAR